MPQRDYRSAIQRYRERARSSNHISSRDADLLISFSEQMDLIPQRIGQYRHKDLLAYNVRLAESVEVELADTLEDREASEAVVRYINRTYDNEETNRDYRDAFRQFGKRVTKGDQIPESIAWIPSGHSRDYDPGPNPSDMLRWEEDVLPMIEETRNSRDAALIATAWNLGARPFEFQEIRVGDVTDSAHGLQVTVDGKKGQRSPTLITAVPYLQRWLSDHPAPNTGSAPLWSKLSSPKPISDRMFRKILEQAAERACITRPVTLSNFRKSCASYLASQNVNQANIEAHMGWTRGSQVCSRYVAVFQEESERQIAKAFGADVEEPETDDIAPVTCPRCQQETPSDRPMCMWCHQALTPEGAAEVRNQRKRHVEAAARGEGEFAEAVAELEGLLEEHPILRSAGIGSDR